MSEGLTEAEIAATHSWMVAATMRIPPGLAKAAFRRGTYKVPDLTKVHVQEIYCAECRRPFEVVAASVCEATADRSHLIGGPIGERKKRVHRAAV